MAIFVFRAHCKRDLFSQAQVPLMKKEFWTLSLHPDKEGLVVHSRHTYLSLLVACWHFQIEPLLNFLDCHVYYLELPQVPRP